MKKLIFLVVLPLIGIGGGVGAGLALRPAAVDAEAVAACGPETHASENTKMGSHDDHGADQSGVDYVKLDNQFVVPLVEGGTMQGLVVISLSLEVAGGVGDTVYMHEPKLRDSFLEVLFEHANIGGFDGDFTDARNLDMLKVGLREAAQRILGTSVTGVLITDLSRQG